jgi:uncharacterized protein YjbI with pentapeptide repeats
VTADLRDSRFAIPRGEFGWWIDGATFEHVDFSGLDLAGLMAIGSKFVACDFAQAKLKKNVSLGAEELSPWPGGGDQRPTVYRGCSFDGADLVSPRGFATVLGAARFEACSFRRARISGWRATRTEFVDCIFEGPIRGCQFHGRDPDPLVPGYPPQARTINEFAGNDFRQADLIDCQFAGGIDITRQHWPTDSDYILIDGVETARIRVDAAIRALDDADQQDTARHAIEMWLPQADDTDQTTQLVRLSWLLHDCPPHTARVLAHALATP